MNPNQRLHAALHTHRWAADDGGAAGDPGLRLPAERRSGLWGEQTHRQASQLVLLGPGGELTVTDATPSTRFTVMAGKPYKEAPVFNGPFVDWRARHGHDKDP